MGATVEELYEQAKRALRQAVAVIGAQDEQGRPFILACSVCGLPFRLDVEVGMMAEHARLEHGVDVDAGDLSLDLIYVGEGPPPKSGP